MKKLTILICVLAILLVSTSAASASREQPTKFRIKGHTTLMDFQGLPFLQSEGKAIRHITGTFTMDEYVLPVFDPENPYEPPSSFINWGTLTITTKKGDEVLIGFSGMSDEETVTGTFQVTSGTGVYEDLIGAAGDYEGIADECDLPCDPLSDPNCVYIEDPDCDGFYVDFTFAD